MATVQIADIRDNKLWIDATAFGHILDKVGNLPVAIVSVSGPMRSGKSYIINHFLRYLTSSDANEDWTHKVLAVQFHWKNSCNRQTTGILVWDEPLVVKRDSRDIAILLVDTQGCFDDKTTTIENSLIFAFTCLLSSVLIYNIKNQISEDMLQFLHLFVGYAKAVIDQDDEESFAELVFLIRDWQCPGDFPFGYYSNHYSCSPKNFKKEKLDVQPDMADECRIVHQEVLSSFRDVGCCLMPYPGNELAYYDKAENADKLFVDTIRDFVPRIFPAGSSTIKKVGGQEMTGFQLKELVKKWAELFTNTEIPPVQNVTEATAQVQNAMASSVAFKFYQTEVEGAVNSNDGFPDDQLQGIHVSKKQEAINMFQRMKRIKHEAMQQHYLAILTEDIEASFRSYFVVNATKRNIRETKEKSAQEMKAMQEHMQAQLQHARRVANARRRNQCLLM